MNKSVTFALLTLMLSTGLFAKANNNERIIPFLARHAAAKLQVNQKILQHTDTRPAQYMMKANMQAGMIAFPKKTVYFNWNPDTKNWDNYPDTTLDTYDSHGNILTETYIYADSLSNYQTKIINSYNFNKMLTGSLSFSRNPSTGKWDSVSKYMYVYDANGNQTDYRSFDYTNGSFIQSVGDKQAFTYNTKKQVTGSVYQSYDVTTSAYLNSSKGIYVLDSSGKITTAEVMVWDSASNSFVKDHYLINMLWYQWNGNIDNSLTASYLSQRWNGNSYQYDFKTKDVYDAKGNSTESKLENFDSASGKWLIYSWTQYAITYDANGNMSETKGELWDTVAQKWVISDWEKFALTYNGTDLTQRIRSDWDTSAKVFNNTYKELYSDFDYVTGIAEILKAQGGVCLYPNPCTHTLNIRVNAITSGIQDNTINIYDITGKVVHQYTLSTNAETLNLDLPKGMYFYRLTDSKSIISSGKLVVE
jgi:hypothetical protein